MKVFSWKNILFIIAILLLGNGLIMSYADTGFNEFLVREPSGVVNWSEDVAAARIAQLSGSAIGAGISQSSNKQTNLDWESGELGFSDGARERVLLGNLEGTGKYGIRIVDKKGNVRLESSDNLEQILMLDESDNEIVKLDNTGLLINTGKITLKDEDETTIIDAGGLVSTANFPFESIYAASDQVVTAGIGSPDDVTGASFSLSLERDQVYLFIFSIKLYIQSQNGNFDGNGIIGLVIDNDAIVGGDSLTMTGRDVDGDSWPGITSYTHHRVKQLEAGNHTIKLVAWIDQGGTGNAQLVINSLVFSYLALGK